MGKTRETTTTQTTPSQAPGEAELTKIQLGQAQAFDPLQRQIQAAFGDLALKLGRGEDLPGFLSGLPGGIGPELTSEIAQKAVEDIRPGLNQQGIIDSGTARELEAIVAGETRRGSAQFNLNNLLQLLNIGVGGQAQVQAPAIQSQGLLGQRLAGLRPVSSTGTSTTKNPFLTGSDIFGGIGTGIGVFGALKKS